MKIQLLQQQIRILVIVLLMTGILSGSFHVVAQTPSLTISGEVIDKATGEPLIGVTVIDKSDPSKGTITDVDGHFTIFVQDDSNNVVFSYVGYRTVEFKAKEVPSVIEMDELSTNLNELVVVGYASQKKVNLTGAVSAISGDEIASRPSSDALSALQGQVPGLQVLRSSGEPGSETSGMRIRGFSSANSTSTLVLVDGVESDLTLVNPNDIESISVLKDAAACAIYGARAAAGVVLVTTKKGKEGKVTVSYNGYVGMNNPGLMPERVPAWIEQEMINESRVQTGANAEWNPEISSWVGNPNFNYRPNNTNGRWDLFESTNWVAEGTKKHTFQTNHNISLSGGSKNTNYMISGAYFSKEGFLKYGSDKNERYNFRINLNTEFNSHISLGVITGYEGKFLKQNSYGSTGILYLLYRSRGRQPIYQPDEDINESPYNGDLQANAIDIMKNGGVNDMRYQNFTGKGTLTIKDYGLKGLALRLSASRRSDFYSSQNSKRSLYWKDRLGTSNRNKTNDPNSYYRQKTMPTTTMWKLY